MSVRIFIEGGGDTAQLKNRCREAFRKLFENCGFRGRMPKLSAVGTRANAFDRFKTALSDSGDTDFAMMLVDSEDPVDNIESTWEHLANRPDDQWQRPNGASDDQVLFMTTCMETWIVADRDALREKFGQDLNENQLPVLVDLESRHRDDVYQRLRRATSNGYSKGRVSFELVGSLDPVTLEQHLPSFCRARRILNEKLSI